MFQIQMDLYLSYLSRGKEQPEPLVCVAADLEYSHLAVRQGASDGGEDGSDGKT